MLSAVRTGAVVVAAGALVLAGCGDDDDGAAPTTQSSTTVTTTTTTPPADTTTTVDDALQLVRCESPDGFAVSAPAEWATNPGDVLPPCSNFDPEPFDVPPATDDRVAAIAAYVDPVGFAVAAAPDDSRDADRAVTAVDGRQAVRLAYEATGDGLYAAGTPITAYLVDVSTPEAERTLFLDLVQTGDRAGDDDLVEVLDRMAQTLEITDPDVDTDPSAVAAYRGGGGGFTVSAEAAGDEVCLRIAPDGEPVCTEPPAADQVHTISLRDLATPVPAGVTGTDVWRVDLHDVEGGVSSYLPADVPGSEVRAYAFHDTVADWERLVLRAVDGTELRVVEPGSA